MTACLEYRDVYGYTIASNTPQWNGSARSVDALTASGYYTFRVAQNAVGVVVGLARDSVAEGYGHIEFGLHFTRGTFQVIENGTPVTALTSFSVDSVFHIVRAGSIIYYCRSSIFENTHPTLPGTPFATSAHPSYGTFYLCTSLYNVDDTIISMGYSDLTNGRGSATGRFMVRGFSSEDTLNNVTGFFKASGSSTGYMATRVSGRFALGGLASNRPYSEARPTFTIGGSASSALHPSISGATGGIEITGDTYGSEYYPVIINGYFHLSGRTSEDPYHDAVGSFRLFGVSGGRRAAPANYFNITLSLMDEEGSDYIAPFAPVRMFPGYEHSYNTFSIPLTDLVSLTAEEAENNFEQIMQSLLSTNYAFCTALPAAEQSENARMWVLNDDISTSDENTELQETNSEYTLVFGIEFDNRTLVSEGN